MSFVKLLAVIQLTLGGIPFIYQGQELGINNQNFRSTSELRDVESLNLYDELCKTMKKEEAFARILTVPEAMTYSPIIVRMKQKLCIFKKRTKYPEGVRLLSNYTEESSSFLRLYEAGVRK